MRRWPALRKSCLRKNFRWCGCVRLGHLDSNQDPQLQRLVCCRCTMPQCGQNCITNILLSVGNYAKSTRFFKRDHFGVRGFPALCLGGSVPKIVCMYRFRFLSTGFWQGFHFRGGDASSSLSVCLLGAIIRKTDEADCRSILEILLSAL